MYIIPFYGGEYLYCLHSFLKTGEVYILYLFLSLCSWPHLQLAPRSLSSISECNMKAFGGNISVFCLLFVIGQTGRRPRNKIYLSRFRPLFILYNNDWLDVSHRIFVVSPGLHCNTPIFCIRQQYTHTNTNTNSLSLSPIISISIGWKKSNNKQIMLDSSILIVSTALCALGTKFMGQF